MKEELLELKKEITILEDFSEELLPQDVERVNELKVKFDEEFEKLSNEDKKWLNTQFFKWLELYINETTCGLQGCSGCAGGCDIEF